MMLFAALYAFFQEHQYMSRMRSTATELAEGGEFQSSDRSTGRDDYKPPQKRPLERLPEGAVLVLSPNHHTGMAEARDRADGWRGAMAGRRGRAENGRSVNQRLCPVYALLHTTR